MPNYRRNYSYSTWFFTVVSHKRMPILTKEKSRVILRHAISACKLSYPFEINAWGLLPDHLHCIWTLPEKDFKDHMNYIHYNPVKHGHVENPNDWPWTSFHRLVKSGIYLGIGEVLLKQQI